MVSTPVSPLLAVRLNTAPRWSNSVGRLPRPVAIARPIRVTGAAKVNVKFSAPLMASSGPTPPGPSLKPTPSIQFAVARLPDTDEPVAGSVCRAPPAIGPSDPAGQVVPGANMWFQVISAVDGPNAAMPAAML